MSVHIEMEMNVPNELDRMLEAFDRQGLDRIYGRALKRSGLEVARRASQGYLRGPRPRRLGVVDGKLYASVEGGVDDSKLPHAIEVGTHLVYGAAWELGTVVFGKGGRKGKRTGMKGKRSKRKKKRADSGRHPGPGKQDARPFLQPALDDLDDKFQEILLEEIQRETT